MRTSHSTGLAAALLLLLPLLRGHAADPYAKAVIFSEILPGNVGNSQSDPGRALGAPDNLEVSMGGPGAQLIVDMGEEGVITDAPGPDLEVREIGAAFGGADESYRVLVSNSTDTNTFVFVGEGRALSLIDIAPSGLPSARYVWLQDLATETLNTDTPGSDIDSLRSLHFTGGDDAVPPPTGLAFRFTGQGIWISWTASTGTNVTGYAIRRSLDGVSFGSTAEETVGPDISAWHDLDLPRIGPLTYAVSAVSGAVESVLAIIQVPARTVALAPAIPVHLGDDLVESWEDPEPDTDWVVEFVLPAGASGPEAELSLDVFDVDYGNNPVILNGAPVDTLPTQGAESWANRTLRLPAGALQPGRNTLRIAARNSGGGTTGGLDDFQIRNLTLTTFGAGDRIELLTAVRITRIDAGTETVTLRWVVEQTPSLMPVEWQTVSGPLEWTGTVTPDQGFFRLVEAP